MAEEGEADSNESAFNGSSEDPAVLGVKMGSTRTVVAREGPTGLETIQDLTCIATYEDAITGAEHVLFGDEAATQYPDRVSYMLRNGLPRDDAATEMARTYLREFIDENGLPEESVAVYAVPSIDNEEGLERFETALDDSGIGEVEIRSYPEALCGAIPAFGDDLEAIEKTFLVANLGSTNLEASAFRNGEQLVPFSTGSVTGADVDREIVENVEEETQGRVNIDLTTAREYKETHADFESYQPFSDTIQEPGGDTYEFTIENAVMDAVDDYLDAVVDKIGNVFMPTLDQQHLKTRQRALQNPIVLTGGMACIPGIEAEFAERLSAELGMDVDAIKPDSPDTAAAEGAYQIADRVRKMR